MEQSVLTEFVTLPSRGLIYPKEMNVPEGLSIKPFKVKDLKGLFGNNSKEALDSLINNCINQEFSFDVKDLHLEDKTALWIRIRAITLGNTFSVKKKCMSCGAVFDVSWNLDDIVVDYLDLDEYPIHVTLPESGTEITMGVILPSDIKMIKDFVSKKRSLIKTGSFDESSELLFSVFAASIKSINNSMLSLESKTEFLSSCTPDDFGYIKQIIDALKFGIISEKEINCPSCGTAHNIQLNSDEEFFRRTHELPKGIRVQKKTIKCNPS